MRSVGSAAPDELTALNGVLYFVANDSVHGNELWRSDGTVTGTTLVSDIFPGSFSANPTHLTNVNGVLYFVSYADTQGGYAIWRSDGTTAGTTKVKTILASGL